MQFKMQFKHQGDIPFYPYSGAITGELQEHTGSVVLALGEKTGHKHTISTLDPNDLQAWKQLEGGWIITLKTEGTLTHNEHGPLTIAPGTYRVGQEREIDWFANGIERTVID